MLQISNLRNQRHSTFLHLFAQYFLVDHGNIESPGISNISKMAAGK